MRCGGIPPPDFIQQVYKNVMKYYIDPCMPPTLTLPLGGVFTPESREEGWEGGGDSFITCTG